MTNYVTFMDNLLFMHAYMINFASNKIISS